MEAAPAMHDAMTAVVGWVADCVELAAAILIAVGAIEAFTITLRSLLPGGALGTRRRGWRRFAVWLLLALEFELAADILRTALSPSWSDIGQLAAIAAIRTFLGITLERDFDLVSGALPLRSDDKQHDANPAIGPRAA